jgi:hypothetical protein
VDLLKELENLLRLHATARADPTSLPIQRGCWNDEPVMPCDRGGPTLGPWESGKRMTIKQFELHEMRLRASSDRALAATAVADQAGPDGLPMLSSIEDDRDVAVLRAVGPGGKPDEELRAALSPYVASRRPVRQYRSRLALQSPQPASYFRLAVTDSGINNSAQSGDPPTAVTQGSAAGTTAQQLWIGAPVDSFGGLLVLVGHAEEGSFAADRRSTSWPLPLSADLGVRIYAGGRKCSQPRPSRREAGSPVRRAA